MAICDYCGEEMLEATRCTANTVVEFPGGEKLPSIPYGGPPCHDCGVEVGEYHHPGCDMEQCPKCAHQLISCGCLD